MKIQDGLELEDGFIEVDEISYVNDKPKNEIGIKIHSGRNRIVRRIFEHLGYQVEKLDRVVFAGLTKKRFTSWSLASSHSARSNQSSQYEVMLSPKS